MLHDLVHDYRWITKQFFFPNPIVNLWAKYKRQDFIRPWNFAIFEEEIWLRTDNFIERLRKQMGEEDFVINEKDWQKNISRFVHRCTNNEG